MPDDFQYIKLPDGSYGKFSSTATDSDIQAAISKDFPQAFASQSASKITGIKATPAPQGWRQKLESAAGNAINDVKYGTDTTALGSVLKKMGAPGLYSGVPQSVGDYMGSPITGPMQVAQGAGQVTQSGKRWQGTKNIVGGALNTAQIPASFVAPEATESALGAAKNILPSTERAGMAFQKVAKIAGESPVQITSDLSANANRIYDLSQRGNTMPKVIRDFLRRVTSPDAPPLSYNEARDFYSKATSLTPDEATKMSGSVKFALRQFTSSLGSAIQDTANAVGQGKQLESAMNEYRRASNLKELASKVWKMLPYVGGAAAVGYEAKRILR